LRIGRSVSSRVPNVPNVAAQAPADPRSSDQGPGREGI